MTRTTVWAVEKGDRPLRLAEATSLASILDFPLSSLLLSEEGAQVQTAVGRVHAAWQRLESTYQNFRDAQEESEGWGLGREAELSAGSRFLLTPSLSSTAADTHARGVGRPASS